MHKGVDVSDFERYLPVHAMVVVGVMFLDGVTLAGLACVASVIGYLYLRNFSGK